jgi:hypothetical protein
MLRRHSNVFRQQGARRQSKTGVVGKGNGILNDFIKHLVLDIQSQVAGSAAIVCTVLETVSQVTYFKNMLVGNKILSPFEQRRGFNHSCAAHADASIPWKLSPGTVFCFISRMSSKRTSRGDRLFILLTRPTILQQSGEIGTAEATD